MTIRLVCCFLLFALGHLSLSAQTEAQSVEESYQFQHQSKRKKATLEVGDQVELSQDAGWVKGKIIALSEEGLQIEQKSGNQTPFIPLVEVDQIRIRGHWGWLAFGIFVLLIATIIFAYSVALTVVAFTGFFFLLSLVALIPSLFIGPLIAWGGVKLIKRFKRKLVLKFWTWKLLRKLVIRRKSAN